MTFKEWLKKKLSKLIGLEHLSEDPADVRLTFVNDEEAVWQSRIQEYRIWYTGDSDELTNWYTGAKASGEFAKSPFYNRTKREYFWGNVTRPNERVKKTHSGVPRAEVDTIINVVGEPQFHAEDDDYLAVLKEILKYNNFKYMLTQEGRPMTLVEGYGAYKINFNKNFSSMPTLQYYNACDVEYMYKDNILVGIVYKDYYKDEKDNNYLLTETRYVSGTNSYIEYELFRKDKNEITKCELSALPELADLKDLVISNFPHILGVPSMYFYDQFHKGYGRSIYKGKLDVFDDMDQCLSQFSTTVRYSTPIEYVNSEFLQRGPNGQIAPPDVYCRRYIMLEGEMDADGSGGSQAVTVTQPKLDFEGFINTYNALLKIATSGILTVSTMGVLEESRPNANAEREREKVTIMTRDNICANEGKMCEDLANLLLCMFEYMHTGQITKFDHGICVKYNEFANPSIENQLRMLGNAWSQGQISTEQFVKLLWKDRLSDVEMFKEMRELEENKGMRYNSGGMGSFFMNNNQYNENEKMDAEAEDTDGQADNPLNQ